MSLKIGVVGATGMVGTEFFNLLEERKFPIETLRPFASQRSEGQSLNCQGKDWTIETLKPGCFKGLDLVFFSSGDDISKEWAPQAVDSGAFAVDNSAAFRMDESKTLCVPEVNGHLLPSRSEPALIANPNCSTIQLVMLLHPLKKFGIKSVLVSSYQSVSGGGKPAANELLEQTKSQLEGRPLTDPVNFPHTIAFNCIPQIGSFNDQGFCSEEMKIMRESRKILSLDDLNISAFTVRVPTLNGHGEAVWVDFDTEISQEKIIDSLREMSNLDIYDNLEKSMYPTVRMADQRNETFVGRIHKDLYNPQRWIFWVVADNLRKGAALNGLQIAEHIFDLKGN